MGQADRRRSRGEAGRYVDLAFVCIVGVYIKSWLYIYCRKEHIKTLVSFAPRWHLHYFIQYTLAGQTSTRPYHRTRGLTATTILTPSLLSISVKRPPPAAQAVSFDSASSISNWTSALEYTGRISKLLR